MPTSLVRFLPSSALGRLLFGLAFPHINVNLGGFSSSAQRLVEPALCHIRCGMATLSPLEKYRALATKLRDRIEFAEFILASQSPASQKAETVALQGRMAIETIAYMALVATEHGLGHLGIPRDAKKHWNAEAIFRRLKSKGLDILPSPSRMRRSRDSRYKWIFEGVSEGRLSYDDLIALYRQFHEGLHAPNPYVQPDDSSFYSRLIPAFNGNIGCLRKFTWVHFVGIKGQAFAVDLRNAYGMTVVMPLSKTAEMPDDIRDNHGITIADD